MTEWNDADHDLLDGLIQRLEDAWQTAGAADLAQFVPAADHRMRERALVALIQVDQELRWRNGQRKTVEEYLAEWPELQEKPACIRDLHEAQSLLEADPRTTPANVSAETQDFAPPNQPRAIQIRCPYCHQPVEILDRQQAGELRCPSCGSTFSAAADTTSRLPSPAGRGAGGEGALHRIAHFELIELLGKGGFGHVWKARDTKLGRIVAIKIPRDDQFSPKEAERFVGEAQAPAELHHPNIVTVHEIGQADDLVYIVSEFVDGETLDDWVKAKGGRLSPREAARLCATIAEALDYAHRCGVRHRDLKPRNIMIDPSGQPHIVDFGLAKRITGEATATIEGAVFGTPAYMSPEQARGEGHLADGRTDIYSLGVILFELLTGERPFSGNVVTLMKHLAEDEPPPARMLRREIPRDMEAICAKCLEKSPSRRYASARELAQDLDLYLKDDLVMARPHGVFERFWLWSKRHPGVAALTAAVALSLVMGATASAILAFQWRHQARVAEQGSRIAKSLQLTSQARELLPANPQRSLSLSFESLMATLNHGESPPPDATRTFQAVLDSIHMKTLHRLLGALDPIRLGALVSCRAIVSPDNHWLVAIGMDNQLRRWDLTTDNPAKTCLVLGVDHFFGDFLSITPDSRWLVASTSRGARLCDLKAQDPAMASGDLLLVEGGHGCSSGGDVPFTVSPDSHWLIMATCSCTQLYDLRRAEPWREPQALHRAGATVRFSQDGRWLVTRGAGEELLWDLATTDLDSTNIQDKGQPAVFTAFAPDSKQLLVMRSGTVPVLWDLTAKKPTQRPSGLGDAADWNDIVDAEFAANGRYLVAKSTVKISLWNWQTHKCLTPWMPPNPGSESPTEPMTLPTKPTQATARSRHQVAARVRITRPAILPTTPAPARSAHLVATQVRDAVAAPAKVPTTPAPAGPAHGSSPAAAATHPLSTVLGPDGRWLLAYRGSSAWLLDLKVPDPGCKPIALEPDTTPIQTVLISPDSHWLLTQSLDAARLWDLQTAKTAPAMKVNNTDKGKPPLAAISPDSHWLALGSGEKTVRVWDLTAKDVLIASKDLDGHENPIISLSFEAKNQLVTWDGWMARRWTLAAGSQSPVVAALTVLPAYRESEGLLASTSGDGRWLISADGGETANLWDLHAPPSLCLPRPLREHKGVILAVAISSDPDRHGRWAVTCGEDKKVCLWDLRSPDPAGAPAVLTDDAEVVSISISPDSHWLVTGSVDNKIRIWDLFLTQESRLKKVIVLSGHEAPVHQIAVSTDAHWLLTGSLDNMILLWELPAADPTPACYVWHNGPPELPSGVRRSENKSLIALTDPTSTLWNQYLQRFPPLKSPETAAQVAEPTQSILAPGTSPMEGASVSPVPSLPGPYLNEVNPSPGNAPDGTFKQPSPSTPEPSSSPSSSAGAPTKPVQLPGPHQAQVYPEFHPTAVTSPTPTPGPQQPTPIPGAAGGKANVPPATEPDFVYHIGQAAKKANGTSTAPNAVPPLEAIVPRAKPVPLDLKPDANAWNLKAGSPLNSAALVLKPAVIKGLRSWTLETSAYRGLWWGGGAGADGGGQLSPDDQLYAAAGRDGVIRFLDSATGKLRIALVNPELDLTAITWSPDNGYVAVGCVKGVVRIWNIVRGTLVIGPTSSSTNRISNLAWSPDGTLLAIARRGESAVILWNVREARQTAVLEVQADANCSVNFLAWSADGKQLMATTDLAVRIWDVAGTRLVQTLDSQDQKDQAQRRAAAWSPDGKRIATLCDYEKVKFFNSTYKLVMSGQTTNAYYWTPASMAWSPDGRHLAGAWLSGCDVLNADSGLVEFGIGGLGWCDGSHGLSWSKDGARLLCTHLGGTVTAVDAHSGKPLWQLAKLNSADTDICISPDGRQYATAVPKDRFYTWDAMQGAPAHDYGQISFRGRGQVAWSNEGRLAVAGGGGAWWNDPCARIWDPGESGPEHLYRDGGCRSAAWSPDGKTLARGGADVLLWTSGSDDPQKVFHTDPEVAKLAWVANNSTLAAGLDNNKVLILEMPSGKVLRTLEREGLDGGVHYLAVLPDGRLVAASGNGAVSVWNSKWETVGDLARLGIDVRDGAMPAGGTAIAFATSDGIVLWDADKQTIQRKVGTGPMFSVGWSIPLHRLIAAQDDRIAIYDEPSGELLASQVIWWGPGKHLFLSPEGHMRCSHAMSEDVVYVALTDDGRQVTLRPTEFAATYGWKNDPEKIRLTTVVVADSATAPVPAPGPSPSPSSPAAAPVEPPQLPGPPQATVGGEFHQRPATSPSPTPGPQQPTPTPVAAGADSGWTAPTSPYSVQPPNTVPAYGSPPTLGTTPPYPYPSPQPSNSNPTAPVPPPGRSPSPSPAAAPKVDLQLTGPHQAAVGEKVTFEAVVTNLGQLPALGLTLRDSFDPGLEHRGTSLHTIGKDLPELAPNASQRVRIPFTVSGTGELCHTVDVCYGKLVLATRKQSLTASPATPRSSPCDTPAPATPTPGTSASPPPIASPGLTLKLKSPPSAAVGYAVVFVMEVTNTTPDPLTDVKVTCLLDANFSVAHATDGYRIEGESCYWTVPSLPPNQPTTFEIYADCVSPGLSACNRVQIASHEGLHADERACVEVQPAEVKAAAGDLEVRISGAHEPINVGEEETYYVDIINRGQQSDSQVRLSVDLPSVDLPTQMVPLPLQTVGPGVDGRLGYKIEQRVRRQPIALLDPGGKPIYVVREILYPVVLFQPVARLDPGQKLSYRVRARTVQPGQVQVRAVVTSQTIQQGKIAQTKTTINGPSSSPVRATAQPASGTFVPSPYLVDEYDGTCKPSLPVPATAGSRKTVIPPLNTDPVPSGDSKDREKVPASAAARVTAVSFSGQFTRPDGSSPGRLFIKAAIKPGWEIYSITQAPKGPTRTEIKVKPSNQFQLGDFQAATPPQKKADPLYKGLIVETHERTAIWYAPLQLAPRVDLASLRIEGTVFAQTCQAGACLAPRDFPFVATLGQGFPVEKVDAAPPLPGVVGSASLSKDEPDVAAGANSVPPNATEDRLLAIGNAYRNAATRLGRPPKDFQELKPSLAGNATEDILRSPNDGEKLVVIWGVDYDRLPLPRDDSFVVAVYEKKGVGGKRYVLRFPLATIVMTDVGGKRHVVRCFCPLSTRVMTDEEWKKAVFPPGYTPPPPDTSAPPAAIAPPYPSSSSQQPPDVGPSKAPPRPVPGGRVFLDTLFPPYHPVSVRPPDPSAPPSPPSSSQRPPDVNPSKKLPPPAPGGQKATSQEHLAWRPFTLAGLKRVSPQFDWDVMKGNLAGVIDQTPPGLGHLMFSKISEIMGNASLHGPQEVLADRFHGRAKSEIAERGPQVVLARDLPTGPSTVLIHFTADWCPNSKLMEATVLSSDKLRRLVERNGVVTMTADWTHPSKDVDKMLEGLGYHQIPVVAVLPARDPNHPICLPSGGTWITEAAIIDALAKAGPSQFARQSFPAEQQARSKLQEQGVISGSEEGTLKVWNSMLPAKPGEEKTPDVLDKKSPQPTAGTAISPQVVEDPEEQTQAPPFAPTQPSAVQTPLEAPPLYDSSKDSNPVMGEIVGKWLARQISRLFRPQPLGDRAGG